MAEKGRVKELAGHFEEIIQQIKGDIDRINQKKDELEVRVEESRRLLAKTLKIASKDKPRIALLREKLKSKKEELNRVNHDIVEIERKTEEIIRTLTRHKEIDKQKLEQDIEDVELEYDDDEEKEKKVLELHDEIKRLMKKYDDEIEVEKQKGEEEKEKLREKKEILQIEIGTLKEEVKCAEEEERGVQNVSSSSSSSSSSSVEGNENEKVKNEGNEEEMQRLRDKIDQLEKSINEMSATIHLLLQEREKREHDLHSQLQQQQQQQQLQLQRQQQEEEERQRREREEEEERRRVEKERERAKNAPLMFKYAHENNLGAMKRLYAEGTPLTLIHPYNGATLLHQTLVTHRQPQNPGVWGWYHTSVDVLEWLLEELYRSGDLKMILSHRGVCNNAEKNKWASEGYTQTSLALDSFVGATVMEATNSYYSSAMAAVTQVYGGTACLVYAHACECARITENEIRKAKNLVDDYSKKV